MTAGRFATSLAVVLLAGVAPAAEADKYLPDDSEFVLFVHVRQVLDSPLAKKYLLDSARNALDSDRFKPRVIFQAMQLNPLQDIASLTLAGAAADPDKLLLIVRGQFDLATIATVADTESQRAPDTLKVHKYRENFLVYQFPAPRHDRATPLFLCFLDKETAVLSPSEKLVHDAIAKKLGKRQTIPSKEMQTLLARVDGRQSLWIAGLVSEPWKKQLGNNPTIKKLIGNMQNLRGGLVVNEGLHADFRMAFGDPNATGEVRKFLIAMQSLVELAVLGGEWSRNVDDILKKMVVLTANRESVRVEIRASAAEIEKILHAKPKSSP